MKADLASLDTTKITDEARDSLRESAIDKCTRLSEFGVINMLAIRPDRPELFIIGIPGDDTLYEVDLSQLVAFTLGALAALEIVREHIMSADMESAIMEVLTDLDVRISKENNG